MSVGVLVVDDDPLVRGALALMMGGRDDVTVVGEAADGRECLEAAARLRPDVILMDLRMPVLGGLEATRELHRQVGHWRRDGDPGSDLVPSAVQAHALFQQRIYLFLGPRRATAAAG